MAISAAMLLPWSVRACIAQRYWRFPEIPVRTVSGDDGLTT